jgi:hypothetical protein
MPFQIKRIITCFHTVSFKRGRTLIAEQDHNNNIYIVKSGTFSAFLAVGTKGKARAESSTEARCFLDSSIIN